MLGDVWAVQHGPTVHAQGFSCWKREADNCDVILVMSKSSAYVESREYIRGSAHDLKAII